MKNNFLPKMLCKAMDVFDKFYIKQQWHDFICYVKYTYNNKTYSRVIDTSAFDKYNTISVTYNMTENEEEGFKNFCLYSSEFVKKLLDEYDLEEVKEIIASGGPFKFSGGHMILDRHGEMHLNINI